MKISKYTKLGLLVISSLAIMIWGINFLKGIDILKRNTQYFVIYERIDGLLESSPVNINGYQVGQVTEIKFMEDYSGKLIATLSLQEDFKIAKGSVARIVSSDIMGTKSVKLEIGKSGEYYRENDTIPGDTESDLKEQVSMQVLPLKNKAEELISSLDSALAVITYVFNRRTQDNLTASFENIHNTLANIESLTTELDRIMSSGKVNSIVGNLDSISGTISNNSENISKIIGNLSELSDSLSKLNISVAFNDLQSSIAGINKILKKLNTSESSAGLLINDTTLYQNLSNLTGSMDLLLKDVRNNPKRYVHFSALDASKEVYITPRANQSDDKSAALYKIHLITSSAPISRSSDLFKGLGSIEEKSEKNKFDYFAGNTKDLNEITQLLEAAKVNFPDADVVAFRNGKRIKLTKAIQNP